MTQTTALVTGASGFLGSLVCEQLTAQGIRVLGWRHKRKTSAPIEVSSAQAIKEHGQHLKWVINLAGSPIAAKPWTSARKQQLMRSRVDFTRQLIADLHQANITVGHFISGSAIGYYGTGAQAKTEDNEPGKDFSAELCLHWERAAANAEKLDAKVSWLRTGLVLHPTEGFLKPLLMAAKLGGAATFGDGLQGYSWVHWQDWLGAVEHIRTNKLGGAFNLTAPEPTSQQAFMQMLTEQLHRPNFLKMPEWLFAPLGEMKTLFIEGQYIKPAHLLKQGYIFQQGHLAPAIKDLFPR